MPDNEPALDLAKFHQMFLEEAADLASAMECGLLRLATEPADKEVLNSVFRAAHSIKGNAGMTGYETAVSFVHTIEAILDDLRNGKQQLNEQLTAQLLEATDCVREILAAPPEAPLTSRAAKVQRRLKQKSIRTSAAVPAKSEQGSATPSVHFPGTLDADPVVREFLRSEQGSATPSVHFPGTLDADPVVREFLRRQPEPMGPASYSISFIPPADCIARGADPIRALATLSEIGRVVSATCHLDNLPGLEQLEYDQSHLSWNLTFESREPESAIRATFAVLALDDQLQLQRAGTCGPDHQAQAVTRGGPRAPLAPEDSVRISCAKLDALFDLVGEVVIAQSMTIQLVRNPGEYQNKSASRAEGQPGEALQRILEDLERNTHDLQDRMMSLRLVPVDQVFKRMPRLVHDLSAQLGKEIRLDIEGEDTEIDRAMVDKLGDPLVHLVRNCADHGIESPEERVRSGKPRAGRIRISARYESGRTVLEIADDGAGLDTGKIRNKALSIGLIGPGVEVTDHQLQMLIFHPGFSTADEVTGVSGRGVGMDAVRKTFESLAGTIQVITERGKGSTFRMTLPITMAIMDGLLLRQGSSTLAIPVANVLECVKPRPESIKSIPGEDGQPSEVFLTRNCVLPVIRLNRVLSALNSGSREDAGEMVVIVEHSGQRYALVTQEILGQQQVLVKSLDANYRQVEGLQGATILPDGRVALVLDLGGVIRMFEGRDRRVYHQCEAKDFSIQ